MTGKVEEERVDNPLWKQQQQQAEWAAAQTVVHLSTDLVAAARRQLRFLAAVDRHHRALYRDGPALRRAIHRYKNCWLPLLAKHGASGNDLPSPLAVPLDCEWIWHCHRLNPVQYRKDCEIVYGRILDNRNVVGSLADGEPPSQEMLQLWQQLYPDEPFDFDSAAACVTDGSSRDGDKRLPDGGFDYDLAAAAERQSSFYYQVSRPTLHDVRTLEAAVARYKGFLYLIKRNQEKAIKRFCVPTYDIDIIWHSHQLHPVSYCNDLMKLVGRVLEHDDTDSDRSKGMKLDVGFSAFTKQWEDEFGFRYWRAGAMYRGRSPSPVAVVPFKVAACSGIPLKCDAKGLQLSDSKVMEVLLQVVSITNLPANLEGKFFVSFGKSQPDMFLQGNCPLGIQSLIGEKQVAAFKCEPKDDLVLTLMSKGTTTYLPVSTPTKAIGKISISLQHLVDPASELTIEKEFELKLNSAYSKLKPMHMHVAASFTVPVPAPHELYLVRSSPFSRTPCFIPSPGSVLQMRRGSCLIDENGNVILDVYIRHLKQNQANVASISKQVIGLMKASGKKCVLAEFARDEWNLLDSQFVLSLKSGRSTDGQIFELKGEHQVRLFVGRKLEFDPNTCKCKKNSDEEDYITFVHFSETDPYGTAVALINLKSGLVKINEGWFVLPGVILAFILSHLRKNERYGSFSSGIAADKSQSIEISTTEKKADEDLHSFTEKAKMVSGTTPDNGGKCGSGCSGSCGISGTTPAEGGKCGSTCSGSCGTAPAKAGKCGSKCSGSCGGISGVLPNKGDMLTKQQHSSGCGSGCGGSGGCGSGCGNVANKSSNCGGCGGGCNGSCGGGCGEVTKKGD